ncbi:capsid protein [Pteropus associated gemycircularvirus 8]|uniref:Capsid protein n=1 Tax=Pteropus associated gemycircularvirus 8 TaxID=1985402 RepID=A0A140CTQ0_9VIRU|nr:capsid protein [Pteropus associated gemycircularvirus 8]AMH87707.1 capsid protein [Pteropus associated gemycircularvirus 8]
MPRYATRRISGRYSKTKQANRYKAKYKRKYKAKRKYGGMSKKKILDLTAIKKRDAMLVSTNITLASPSGSTSFNNNGAVLGPNRTYFIPWIATWRDNSTVSGGAQTGTRFDTATRTATTCYMRGLKEQIYFIQNDGSQWMWRRICFKYRGPVVYQQSKAGYTLAVETSNGFQRLYNNINDSSGANMLNTMIGIMFRGQVGVDYGNFFNAPTDNTRCEIVYDKTRSLATGNQNGYSRRVSLWHGMNKNLVYDDDEAGGAIAAGNASVSDKRGMGDYYVVDMFICEAPQSSSSQLIVVPEATLYWHEK